MPCCLSYYFSWVSGSRHGGEVISEKTYACVLFLENERAEGEREDGNVVMASRRYIDKWLKMCPVWDR